MENRYQFKIKHVALIIAAAFPFAANAQLHPGYWLPSGWSNTGSGYADAASACSGWAGTAGASGSIVPGTTDLCQMAASTSNAGLNWQMIYYPGSCDKNVAGAATITLGYMYKNPSGNFTDTGGTTYSIASGNLGSPTEFCYQGCSYSVTRDSLNVALDANGSGYYDALSVAEGLTTGATCTTDPNQVPTMPSGPAPTPAPSPSPEPTPTP